MNLVTGHGIVTEAELTYTGSGLAILNLAIDAGKTQYVTAFGGTAEKLSTSKGMHLSWWGRISSNVYTTKDGRETWHMKLRLVEGEAGQIPQTVVKQTMGMFAGEVAQEQVKDRDQVKQINTMRFHYEKQNGVTENYLVQLEDNAPQGQASGELEYRTFEHNGLHIRTFLVRNNANVPSPEPVAAGSDASPWN